MGGSPTGRSRAVSLEPEPVRVYPQAGGAAGTTLAAHLLGFVNRDGEGQYGIEERYQTELGGHGPGPPRRSRRRRPAGHRHRPGRQPGRARVGPAPDDRHRPPAGRRAGGPRRLHRRQGRRGHGHRDGPLQRGDPGRGELPVVRRERLPDGRPGGPQGVHRPDRVVRLRAGLGVQDVHRAGRSREGHDQPVDPDPRLGLALARPRRGPDLRRRPARDGLHGGPRHRGLLAQRRGGPDRARAGQHDGEGVQAPGRDLDPPRVRPEERRRPGRRGPGHGPRPGAQALEPGRPRERVVRPGRRGHPAPARHGLRGDGQRRDARHPPRRARGRRPRRRARRPRAGDVAGDEQDARRPHEPRRPHRPVVRREDPRPRLRRRRQDGHGPDLGPQAEPRPGRLEGEPLQPHVRRLHRPGRPRSWSSR